MTLRNLLIALLLPMMLVACGGAAEEELPTVAPTTVQSDAEETGDDTAAEETGDNTAAEETGDDTAAEETGDNTATEESAGEGLAGLNITPVAPPEVEGLVVPVSTTEHEFEVIFPNDEDTWSIADEDASTITNGDVTLDVFIETFDEAGDRSDVAAARYPGASVEALEDTERPTYVVTDDNLYEIYVGHQSGFLVYGLTAEEGDAAAIQDTLVDLLNGVNINQLP